MPAYRPALNRIVTVSISMPQGRFLAAIVAMFGVSLLLGGNQVGAKRRAPPFPPPTPVPGNIRYDFDNDGKTDVGRWDKDHTEFKVKNSNGGSYSTYTIGSSSDVAAPGDFNGDGKTDPCVFYNGTWTYKLSPTPSGTPQTISLGQSGDTPMAGDYDGDGITDAAIFRPSTGDWIRKNSSDGKTVTQNYGQSGDIPIAGNFNGDAKTDFAVYRITSGLGYWYVLINGGSGTSYQFGQSGDIPIQGDFDADGKSDIVIYRPLNGQWWVLTSSSGFTYYYCAGTWGSYGDQPVAGDYDGDGHTDMAIWRPTTGVWMIVKSTDSSYDYKTLGIAGDEAVPSAYTKQVGTSVGGDVMGPLRLKPTNATGGTNLYSQNFGWSTSLVSLPGRAGLDASLGISYNSLVWIKSGSNIYFDPDSGNISPGFRFGFPTIDPVYYDSAKSKWTYLMVTPDGGRKEFRQIGASDTFDAADSSYARLIMATADGSYDPNLPPEPLQMKVLTTDGTTMQYKWIAGAFRCYRITDRNGNYMTMAYDADYGQLLTVTDTLGRVVTVHYDSQLYPTSVTQTWKDDNGHGSDTTHTWASFTYTTQTVATSFSGVTNYGPPNDTVIKVLDKITYADGSATGFDYNGYVQVTKVRTIAPDSSAHVLNYVSTNLASPSPTPGDCPRFTQTKTYAENFNGDAEVTTGNTAPAASSFTGPNGSESTSMVTVTTTNHPTSAYYTQIHFGPSGYKEGLTIATEDCITSCTGTGRVRWTWNDWTQDSTGVSYITNPRVTESRVGDGTNIKKTTISYYTSGGTYPYGLPETISVGDGTSVTKTEKIIYNLSSNFTDRRIIGLPSEKYLYQGGTSDTLMSKVTYTYDGGSLTDLTTPTHQCKTTSTDCPTAYGTSFTYRGNLTTTTRCDATYPTSCTNAVSSSTAYNIAGSPVSSTDPRGRVTTLSYVDANMWNDGVSRTTYAYPTTVTDPGSNSSTIKYRFDMGASVEATGPPPGGQTYGKTVKREFDDYGRPLKESIYANTTLKFYTRYGRPSPDDGEHLSSYTTIVDVNSNGPDSTDEVETLTVSDGAGRVLNTRTLNPDSSGGYTGKKFIYDILGRVTGESPPTEVNSSIEPYGDDYHSNTWLMTQKTYDWKGRVTRIIPTDSNGTDGKDTLMEYAGCGCAGGQVTTVRGPVTTAIDASGNPQTTKRRVQKAYEDVLGRTYKSELWDLDGGGSTPYSTTKTTLNGRDQATLIRTYSGSDSSSTYQDVTMTYDGHGRLLRKYMPEESGSTPYTENAYNADDTLATVTDARGMARHFKYGYVDDGSSSEYRNLLTKVSYTRPLGSSIELPVDVTFAYDGPGNRTSMAEATGGTGTTNYYYDELSRMTSETKTFPTTFTLPDSPNSGSRAYTISYNYFLNGSVKEVVDPFSYHIYYTADKVGRMKTVTGTAWGDTSVTQYIDDVDYRAWGAEKEIDFHNYMTETQTFDTRLRPSTYKLDRTDITSHVYDKSYTYLPDDKLSHSTEGSTTRVTSGDFERSYAYDFAGRIGEARTGYEARNQQPQSGDKIPYHTDYTYDAFNHNTDRTGSIWFGIVTDDNESQSWSATTNKVTGWTYDAAGNTTYSENTSNDTSQTYTYNAAGTMNYARQDNHNSSSRTLDGMQRPIFISQTGGYNYLIYSTVFGKVLMETNGSGAKQRTYVHDLGGKVMAVQQTNFVGTNQYKSVRWEYTDPGGASFVRAIYDGSLISTESTELDTAERAVRMFNFDTEQEPYGNDHPFGDEFGCREDKDTPKDCTGFLSKQQPKDCPAGTEPRKDAKGEWQCVGVGDVNGGTGYGEDSPIDETSAEYGRDNQSKCDSRIARVFGDDQVVVGTAYDPPGVLGNPNGNVRNRIGLRGEDPTQGVIHIYSNAAGSPRSGDEGFVGNLFAPRGFSTLFGKADPNPADGEPDTIYSNIQVIYPRGGLSQFDFPDGLRISFIHSGPINGKNRIPSPFLHSKITNEAGSVLIGVIGADGSAYDGGGAGGLSYLDIDEHGHRKETPNTPAHYIHTHAIFYRRDRRGRESRVDPRSVFCRDLGF